MRKSSRPPPTLGARRAIAMNARAHNHGRSVARFRWMQFAAWSFPPRYLSHPGYVVQPPQTIGITPKAAPVRRRGPELETEAGMRGQRSLLIYLILAAAAMPACGQGVAPAAPVNSGAPSAAAIPDFSGTWGRFSFPGMAPPRSGPGPVANKSRRRQSMDDALGSTASRSTRNPAAEYAS